MENKNILEKIVIIEMKRDRKTTEKTGIFLMELSFALNNK